MDKSATNNSLARAQFSREETPQNEDVIELSPTHFRNRNRDKKSTTYSTKRKTLSRLRTEKAIAYKPQLESGDDKSIQADKNLKSKSTERQQAADSLAGIGSKIATRIRRQESVAPVGEMRYPQSAREEQDYEEEEGDGGEIESIGSQSAEREPQDTSRRSSSSSEGTSQKPTASADNDGVEISFELATNNLEAMEMPQSRRGFGKAAPVYPPGDANLLYSDALLVYVKDFNQFIKE